MRRVILKDWIKSKENIFILFVVFVKLILMGLFSSDYQNKLFVPFMLDFVKKGGNVYERFYESGVYNAFPYPTCMLLTESLGAFLISLLHISNQFMTNLLFKLPSFIIDLIGLKVLNRFYPEKHKYNTVFYYASPIVLYSVYMHGQLDLIPMIMLIISLYMLTSKKGTSYKYLVSCMFLIISILCKFHIIAVVPVFFFYIQKREGIRKAFIYVLSAIAGVIIGIIPFWSDGFVKLVLMNPEQSVIAKVSFPFDTVEMYIPVVAVLFVYLLAFKISNMNTTLFFNLCGVVFAVFLAFCPPMPGWYVWIVPFMSLFFAFSDQEKYKNIYIYIGLNAIYVIYFVFLHNRGMVDLYFLNSDFSFIKIDSPLIRNGAFTLLSGVLIYLFLSMYRVGVASSNLYKRRDIPFTIGVAGDSGAGKSTMVSLIESMIGTKDILFIEGDGDHRWERGDHYWDDYTALNPKANYLYKQANDLKSLRYGNAVRRFDYDHSTGKFSDVRRMISRKYVVLCGLHAIYLPQTRKNLDLKIYMDSDETLRRYWKIQRDTRERGHTKETVLKSIQDRIPDAMKFIYPQKDYADMIVQYYDNTLTDCMEEDHEVNMSIRLTISAAVNVEPLAYELNRRGISVEYEYSDDLRNQHINIDNSSIMNKKIDVEAIAERVIPQLEEITRERLDNIDDAVDGIVVLFLLLLISNKMQGLS